MTTNMTLRDFHERKVRRLAPRAVLFLCFFVFFFETFLNEKVGHGFLPLSHVTSLPAPLWPTSFLFRYDEQHNAHASGSCVFSFSGVTITNEGVGAVQGQP